eukprot:6207218-Pleurochrysis_carterae.AAC.6
MPTARPFNIGVGTFAPSMATSAPMAASPEAAPTMTAAPCQSEEEEEGRASTREGSQARGAQDLLSKKELKREAKRMAKSQAKRQTLGDGKQSQRALHQCSLWLPGKQRYC